MQKSVLPSMHTGNRCLKNKKTKESVAKTGFSCITEAHESTRQRTESVTKRIHEEHIAGNGPNSALHYNLVHRFIPMPQAMKIPDAKAAVDKEWEKAWDNSSMEHEKSREQKGCHKRGTEKQQQSSLCFTDGLMSCKEIRVGAIPEVQRKSRALWKTTPEPMQYLLNRAYQHRKWRPQR